jgi:hypothetical protein
MCSKALTPRGPERILAPVQALAPTTFFQEALMDKSLSRQRAEARAAARRLQEALREEIKRRGADCRYVAGCPVAKAGECPGIC